MKPFLQSSFSSLPTRTKEKQIPLHPASRPATMEMETSSSIHDQKSMVNENGDESGAGHYDPGNSPGASYIDTSLNAGSEGKLQHNINRPDTNHVSIDGSISPGVSSAPITQNEERDGVSEYGNVRGGSDQQNTLSTKSSRNLRSRVSGNSSSKLEMDSGSGHFMDSLHDPSGFAIDPALGTRVSSTQGDHRILSQTPYQKSQSNGYEQRSQERSEEAAAVALSASAQVDYFRQQSQMQQNNHAAHIQLQAQVQMQRQQRQLQQLHQQQHQHHQQQQQQTTPNQRSLQHAQQAAYLSKQSQNYHMQHTQDHQLQQSLSTEDDEIFGQHMSPNNTQTPEGSRDRSLRHSTQTASPYTGMDMMTGSQYTPTGHLSSQLSQFNDPMVVVGMDFNLRPSSPMGSNQMTMIPPPPPSSNGGTPGLSGSVRKRKASSMGSVQGDSDAIAELKVMARNTMTGSLADLAVQVREEETGSSAEKYKQIFAMAWLKKNCEISPDAAVPRNRIYARYVELCAEFNLKPLNPASFGKLVRVAYPGIKTRRLGVRGQSKYHYCGFRLMGDQNNATGNTPTGTPGRFGNSPDLGVKNQYDNGQFGFPSQSPHSTPSQSRFRSSSTPVSELESKLSREGLDDFTQVGGNEMGPVLDLRFHNVFSDFPNISLSATAHEVFSIPRLDNYLTSDIDPDFATTLYSLYLSHCRSLVESLRFMHIKKFLHFMGSFVGSLTSPVQNLLKNEEVTTWIMQVDWVMYKVSFLRQSTFEANKVGNGTHAEPFGVTRSSCSSHRWTKILGAISARASHHHAR